MLKTILRPIQHTFLTNLYYYAAIFVQKCVILMPFEIHVYDRNWSP